jgi:hypothetical protein
MLYYMYQIVEEGDSKRLQEFKDVVGLANGLALEAIGDIPKHRMGFFIDNVNTDQQKQYLVQLADQMVKAGQLDIEALNLIIKVDNYKYAAVLMILKYKQKQRQNREEQERQFQQQMALKQQDLEITRQQFVSKEEAKVISIEAAKRMDYEIEKMKIQMKSDSQAMRDEIKKNNKIETDNHKAQLENAPA